MTRGNPYALLGLEGGATGDQIDQAYRSLAELYREDSLATYSLVDAAEARQIRTQLREAYDLLRDPLRRLEYDVRHGHMGTESERPTPRPPTEIPALVWEVPGPASETVAPETPPGVVTPTPAPASPPARREAEATPVLAVSERSRPERGDLVVLEEPICGAALRAFREARGVSLREISTRTKVSLRYLEYIEGDRFDFLPAPVYLRGFVQEYARAAGLDPRRTAESYLNYVSKSLVEPESD